MSSTGNDIVALKAIDITRTKQHNFYSKIISNSEKQLYERQLSGVLSFEHFIWLLWAIKESAYKYLQRLTLGLIFSPAKIIINTIEHPRSIFTGDFEGVDFNDQQVYKNTITFNKTTLHSRSIINSEFIFSVVNEDNNFENTHWGIKPVYSTEHEYQSRSVRIFLVNSLNNLFPGEKLQIDKSPYGYPIVLKDGIAIPIPISLAHHDHYVAFSYQVKNKIMPY